MEMKWMESENKGARFKQACDESNYTHFQALWVADII